MLTFFFFGLFTSVFSFSTEVTSNNMPSQQNDTIYYIPGKVKETTRLFSDMENSSSVVLYIPADSMVQILKPENEYFAVHFHGIDGYIFQKKVENYASVLKEFNQPATDREIIRNNTGADRYHKIISKYGQNIGEKIAVHKIWKGMSPSMVMDSWGKPQQINNYTEMSGTKEIWMYLRYSLIFRDKRLTSWYKRGDK